MKQTTWGSRVKHRRLRRTKRSTKICEPSVEVEESQPEAVHRSPPEGGARTLHRCWLRMRAQADAYRLEARIHCHHTGSSLPSCLVSCHNTSYYAGCYILVHTGTIAPGIKVISKRRTVKNEGRFKDGDPPIALPELLSHPTRTVRCPAERGPPTAHLLPPRRRP